MKENRDHYRWMVEEIEDYAILLLDTGGIVQNWNKGAERIKGYKDTEIIGRSFRIFYLPEDQASGLPERLIEEAKQKGKAIHEGWRVRKDQSTFWGSIVITALHSPEQELIGFTKVTRDLTERRNAELSIRQYAAELEAQNKELAQFTYVASHDLQEPLRKIKTFSEMLRVKAGANLDKESLDLISRMQSASARMSRLIGDLLDYSKVSAEKDAEFTLLDPSFIIRDILLDLKTDLTGKGATVEVGGLYPLRGNEWQIRQLFENLLSNSIKYSKAGIPLSIQLEASIVAGTDAAFKLPEHCAARQFQQIMLRDNGIGFEQQYARKIFQVFQRLHGKNDYEGTGIGLAIVQRVVEAHHGFIQAAGTPGEGATFTLLLPYGEATQ